MPSFEVDHCLSACSNKSSKLNDSTGFGGGCGLAVVVFCSGGDVVSVWCFRLVCYDLFAFSSKIVLVYRLPGLAYLQERVFRCDLSFYRHLFRDAGWCRSFCILFHHWRGLRLCAAHWKSIRFTGTFGALRPNGSLRLLLHWQSVDVVASWIFHLFGRLFGLMLLEFWARVSSDWFSAIWAASSGRMGILKLDGLLGLLNSDCNWVGGGCFGVEIGGGCGVAVFFFAFEIPWDWTVLRVERLSFGFSLVLNAGWLSFVLNRKLTGPNLALFTAMGVGSHGSSMS